MAYKGAVESERMMLTHRRHSRSWDEWSLLGMRQMENILHELLGELVRVGATQW